MVTGMMADRERVEAWYSGHVQGVGFRQRTLRIAADFNVFGEVRNLSDGRVELQAEGSRAELLGFLRAIDESLGSFIRGKQVDWSEATGAYSGFHVAPDRFVG
jgi:acylphosphatase